MASSKSSEVEVAVWHPQEEEILREWAETAASYRWLHNASRDSYRSLYTWFSLPVILLSTIAGTANFATASFPEAWRSNVTLVVGGINLVSGMITTVAQFYSISENLEGHRVSSTEFGKLSRHITIELSLPVQQRSMSGAEFIKECRQRLDQLQEKAPNIPVKILKLFGSKFSNANFTKPDILEINNVNIYRNGEELLEKERKKLEAIRLEEQQKLEAMRQAAADEVRLHIETKAEEVAKKRHMMKKKKVSAMNIADSMTRLISSIENTNAQLEETFSPPPPPISENEEDEEKNDADSNSSVNTVCTVDLLEGNETDNKSTASSSSSPSKNKIKKR